MGLTGAFSLIGAQPLANRVVRDAVATTGTAVAERTHLANQPRVRRPLDTPRTRPGPPAAVPSGAALSRAVPLVPCPWDEGGAASLARPRLPRDPLVPRAMSLERGRAVRAEDPEVLDPVVIADAIDVVEDQSHRPAAPLRALATVLADRGLETGVVKAPLQVTSREGRPLDEDRVQRNRLSEPTEGSPGARPKMVGSQTPAGRVLLEHSIRATRLAHPESRQDIGPAPSDRDGVGGFLSGVARTGHTRTYVRTRSGGNGPH